MNIIIFFRSARICLFKNVRMFACRFQLAPDRSSRRPRRLLDSPPWRVRRWERQCGEEAPPQEEDHYQEAECRARARWASGRAGTRWHRGPTTCASRSAADADSDVCLCAPRLQLGSFIAWCKYFLWPAYQVEWFLYTMLSDQMLMWSVFIHMSIFNLFMYCMCEYSSCMIRIMRSNGRHSWTIKVSAVSWSR